MAKPLIDTTTGVVAMTSEMVERNLVHGSPMYVHSAAVPQPTAEVKLSLTQAKQSVSELNLDSYVDFTFNFGGQFLLGPLNGKYWVWNSPDYGGDNTIRPWSGNPRNFAMKGHGGRCKGKHIVRRYCGEDVKFIT